MQYKDTPPSRKLKPQHYENRKNLHTGHAGDAQASPYLFHTMAVDTSQNGTVDLRELKEREKELVPLLIDADTNLYIKVKPELATEEHRKKLKCQIEKSRKAWFGI